MEQWNSFCEGLKEFFNQPVTVIVASIFSFAVVIFGFLSRTSIGKKALNHLKCEINAIKGIVREEKGNCDKTLTDIKNECEKALFEINEKYGELKAEYQKQSSFIVAVCENINNKKVKELANEYIVANDIKVKEYIENFEKVYAEKLHELDELIAHYKELIEEKAQEVKEVVENGEE